jgi:tetratricopeptide (TPR) repeat protein
MSAGLTIFRLAAAVGVLLACLAAWRAASASREAAALHNQASTLAQRVDEIERLRPRRATALLASRPTESVSAALREALAAAGVGDAPLRSVAPGADEPLRTGNAEEAEYRRQSVSVTLAPITVRQLGAFLAAWRDAEPAWIVTRLDLTHAGPDTEPDSTYDARLTLTTPYPGPHPHPPKDREHRASHGLRRQPRKLLTRSTMRRLDVLRLLILAAVPLAAIVPGCGGSSSSVYTASDPQRRDPSRADQLNLEAAGLMVSDPAKAEALLREALTADLYHGPAHNNLGVLFLKQDRLYEAAGEFEWARKLLPGHPDPRLNLSLTLESAGRFDQAADHARTALQIHPGHIASLQQLTRLELMHPNVVNPGKARPDRTSNARDPEARETLRANLNEIALRGESSAWKDWARLQLVKLDGGK